VKQWGISRRNYNSRYICDPQVDFLYLSRNHMIFIVEYTAGWHME